MTVMTLVFFLVLFTARNGWYEFQVYLMNKCSYIYASGAGRHGQVFKAHYQSSIIAMKVFPSREEQSYEQERRLYRDVGLKHENVLAFLDCDTKSVNSVTQFWLLTEFHPQGSSDSLYIIYIV